MMKNLLERRVRGGRVSCLPHTNIPNFRTRVTVGMYSGEKANVNIMSHLFCVRLANRSHGDMYVLQHIVRLIDLIPITVRCALT